MARQAASITCSGVLKSGSPWASSTMLAPVARSSRARCAALAEAEMRARAARAANICIESLFLVDDDVLLADEARPLFALGADVLGEGLRRPADRLGALLGELLAHLRRGKDRIKPPFEPIAPGARRARRHRDAAPGERLVARH